MSAPLCVWEHCDRPGRISVIVGAKKACEASAHGAFCVPHSALTSRVLHQSRSEVWFDWVRSDRSHDCTCDPLFWSTLTAEYDSARLALGGAPQFNRVERPDDVDPVGWAR